MFAITSIAGKQFKVEEGQEIFVYRLQADEGSQIEVKEVQLVDNAGKVKIGKPFVKGAKIKATVLEHLKDDKIIVFKKKRRKGYRVKNGHRQALTKLKIDSITA